MNGTTAGLKAGYWITLRDLLYAVMLPSGNDAAQSIS
jgi:D-alanyl-D-alanine carboxypeptidase